MTRDTGYLVHVAETVAEFGTQHGLALTTLGGVTDLRPLFELHKPNAAEFVYALSPDDFMHVMRTAGVIQELGGHQ